MSLDWNVENIEDYETVCWHERELSPNEGGGTAIVLHPVTEALIYWTMGVGLNQITEANADRFFERSERLNEVNGKPLVQWKDGERTTRGFTRDEIRAHIGLRTNASILSDAEFDTSLEP